MRARALGPTARLPFDVGNHLSGTTTKRLWAWGDTCIAGSLCDGRTDIEQTWNWTQSNGRPRERWRVSDYAAHAVLDASQLRRECLQSKKGDAIPCWLSVRYADRTGVMQSAIVAIEAIPHTIYGRRWFLCCPRCGSRRVKLCITRTGPACWRCLRLTYTKNVKDPAERPPKIATS